MTSAQQCTICYDELTSGLSAAPCGHVFHTVCIETWQKTGRYCPICHKGLPTELLKLFYEPQEDCGTNATIGDASAGACAGACAGAPVSAEVKKLRIQLACSTKFIEASKEAHLKHLRELQDLKRSKDELEATAVSATANLETTRINLFKKNKELNKLRRETEGTFQRLREMEGEKVAHGYLNQFSSPARGRVLSGLGQVDVEKVIGQIRQGNMQAEAVIRGQHAQLTGAMYREQKTKRELTERETVELELKQVQSKLSKAKKEAHRLEKSLATRSAPLSTLPGAILGDWVAEERPPTAGGERTWALTRKPSNGGSGSALERSASVPVGGFSAAAAADSKGPGTWPAKRRRSEKEEDLVSLGSDDEDDGGIVDDDDDGSEDEDERTRGGKRSKSSAALTWERFQPLPPVASSRSFLTSTAAVAGGKGGAQQNGKRARFISSGHNAVGGRHKVLLPSSFSSSASSSLKNPFCLGGKHSRLAASSRH